MNAELETRPRSQVYPARLKTVDLDRLRAIQAKTGATIAEQIRRAVSRYLDRMEKR